MLLLLENEIRTIPSLKVVEISGSTDVSFAESTITWLRERNVRRIREALDEEAKKKVAEAVRAHNIRCGFCGE